jgi:hypothetical protein
MKKILFAAMALCCFSASAEWVHVKNNSEGDKTFFDPKTIGIYETHRKAWVLVNFSKPEKSGSEPALSKSIYYKFDCKDARISVIAELTSSEPGGAGKQIKNVSFTEDVWVKPTKDEVMHKTLEQVCAR